MTPLLTRSCGCQATIRPTCAAYAGHRGSNAAGPASGQGVGKEQPAERNNRLSKGSVKSEQRAIGRGACPASSLVPVAGAVRSADRPARQSGSVRATNEVSLQPVLRRVRSDRRSGSNRPRPRFASRALPMSCSSVASRSGTRQESSADRTSGINTSGSSSRRIAAARVARGGQMRRQGDEPADRVELMPEHVASMHGALIDLATEGQFREQAIQQTALLETTQRPGQSVALEDAPQFVPLALGGSAVDSTQRHGESPRTARRRDAIRLRLRGETPEACAGDRPGARRRSPGAASERRRRFGRRAESISEPANCPRRNSPSGTAIALTVKSRRRRSRSMSPSGRFQTSIWPSGNGIRHASKRALSLTAGAPSTWAARRVHSSASATARSMSKSSGDSPTSASRSAPPTTPDSIGIQCGQGLGRLRRHRACRLRHRPSSHRASRVDRCWARGRCRRGR